MPKVTKYFNYGIIKTSLFDFAPKDISFGAAERILAASLMFCKKGAG